jgi:hypothetical protein
MRHALLLLLLSMAATSTAAAQSCSTLGSQIDCRVAPTKQPTNKQPTNSSQPARASQDVEVQGDAETTVSNSGVSTTLNNRIIDSQGVVEFGLSGSANTPCRVPGYGAPCR